jgi:hypothetical protein
MLAKTKRWTFALITTLLVVTWTLLSQPAQVTIAQAQAGSPEVNSSCVACHDNLYYLHDMGKSYCLTEKRELCVDCHEGNATVMDKGKSHQGLILYPQRNDGEKCQECHPQDAQAHLEKFDAVAGYKPVIESIAYAPSDTAVSDFPDVPEENIIVENLPWLAGAVVLFGLWLALVIFSPLKP